MEAWLYPLLCHATHSVSTLSVSFSHTCTHKHIICYATRSLPLKLFPLPQTINDSWSQHVACFLRNKPIHSSSLLQTLILWTQGALPTETDTHRHTHKQRHTQCLAICLPQVQLYLHFVREHTLEFVFRKISWVIDHTGVRQCIHRSSKYVKNEDGLQYRTCR